MTADIMDAVDDSLRELSTTEDPWTNRKNVRSKTRGRGFPLEAAKKVAADLEENDSAFVWFGYVVRSDPDVIQAAIEDEADSEVTRTILLGRLNQRRKELAGGEGR